MSAPGIFQVGSLLGLVDLGLAATVCIQKKDEIVWPSASTKVLGSSSMVPERKKVCKNLKKCVTF